MGEGRKRTLLRQSRSRGVRVTTANLLRKYDVPAPRYTSYPTVPYWSDNPTREEWLQSLRSTFANPKTSWSLYLHIPFCENLCTYCGCNTAITRNHKVEEPYIESILSEWNAYLAAVPDFQHRPLRELHLGGGTPTFLSPENLRELISGIFASGVQRDGHFQASLEVDPRHTTREHLLVLQELGFSRISMGVQDYDPKVQEIVNRIQPFSLTKELTESARALGYISVNHDLIYGLPKQTLASVQDTVAKTITLRPDRIALYSYAHVPWIKASQRRFTEDDLPKGDEKRALYEYARSELLGAGYLEIGMDHFALPSDSLSIAAASGELHRNFMGYTHSRTDILLGLGVSAISESPDCFHQNEKVLRKYEQLLESQGIPSLRGHKLSSEDKFFREQILQLMTQFQLVLRDVDQVRDVQSFLAPMIEDALVIFEGQNLIVPDAGRPFLRNICMALDQRMRLSAPERKIFSQSM